MTYTVSTRHPKFKVIEKLVSKGKLSLEEALVLLEECELTTSDALQEAYDKIRYGSRCKQQTLKETQKIKLES